MMHQYIDTICVEPVQLPKVFSAHFDIVVSYSAK